MSPGPDRVLAEPTPYSRLADPKKHTNLVNNPGSSPDLDAKTQLSETQPIIPQQPVRATKNGHTRIAAQERFRLTE